MSNELKTDQAMQACREIMDRRESEWLASGGDYCAWHTGMAQAFDAAYGEAIAEMYRVAAFGRHRQEKPVGAE